MMMPAKADHANLSVYQASHDQPREQLVDAARAAVEPVSRFPRGQLPRYLPHDASPATTTDVSHPDALGGVTPQRTAMSDADSRRVRIRAQRGPLWARTAQGDGR